MDLIVFEIELSLICEGYRALKTLLSPQYTMTSQSTTLATKHSSGATIYEPEKLDTKKLATRTLEVLGRVPFEWQMDAAAAILCGKDVVLDVGTACGKSLCFSMPLVMNDTDISLRITPLTALMVDQVSDINWL